MFGKFSLTTRLTLFFTALSSAVILGLSILFIVSTGRHFVDLDSSALDDKKHLIEDILVSSKTVSEAQTRLNEALDHHHGLYVLVRSSQGEIFYQTAGYSEPAEQHSRIKTKGEHEMQTWSIAGQDFRATSFEARMAQGTADILKVDIAVNTDHHKQFLKDIQQSVLAYAVLATLVTGLLAWFAAHQGMSPLRSPGKDYSRSECLWMPYQLKWQTSPESSTRCWTGSRMTSSDCLTSRPTSRTSCAPQ
jgi:two-component system heavy metal sensor histidine kinase CusS